MVRIGQKDFADLGEISLGVDVDLLAAEDGAGGVSAGGIADAGSVIADDQHRLVSQLLELPDDSQRNRMSERDVGSGGIHAELDPQRLAGLGAAEQFAPQIVFVEDSLAAAGEELNLLIDGNRHLCGGILEAECNLGNDGGK